MHTGCYNVSLRMFAHPRSRNLRKLLAFDFNTEGIPKLYLGWRWEDLEGAVMLACSSLMMIVKYSDSRVVQFSHFSVQEVLMADRLAEPMRDVSRFLIRLEAAHTTLVQECLGVLLQLDDLIDGFPLARYSAQYWATHWHALKNVSHRIKVGMKFLFDAVKPHFAAWLWIYNQDRGSSMSTRYPEEPEAVPLYHTARFGCHDLAEHPDHVNATGSREGTLMHVVALAGHSDVLSLMIEHGADMNGRASMAILHCIEHRRTQDSKRDNF
jgi:hypothetical protein